MTSISSDSQEEKEKVAAAKVETFSGKFLKIFLKSQIGQANIPLGKTWNFPKYKQGKKFLSVNEVFLFY